MKIRNIILLLVAMTVAQTQVLIAQSATQVKKDWTLLGTHKVDFLIDHDEVDLQGNSESVSTLKFAVTNGTLNMHKCTIHFADGKTTDVDFDNKGEETAPSELVVDLKGNKAVEKITFWYDTDKRSDNKATLEVWGKKS